MCLLSPQGKLKKAEKDIPCLKVIRYGDGRGLGSYRAYFQTGCAIPESVVSGERPYVAEGEAHPSGQWSGFVWNGGLIHTYTTDYNNGASWLAGLNTLIFEAVIPKGTEYVEGTDMMYHPCYASKQIVFGKLLYDGR